MKNKIESPVNQEIIIKIIFFLSYASFSAWLSFYNLFLKKYIGFSDSQVGLISGVQQINILLVLPIWGIMADRFGRRNILLVALFVTLCLFYGFLFQKLFFSFFIFTFFITLFYSPLSSLLDTIALDYNEQANHSSYGNIRLWGSLGWAISSLTIGNILSIKNLNLIFPIASLLMLLSWLIVFFTFKSLSVKKNLIALKMTHVRELVLNDRRLSIFLFIILLYGISSAPIQYYINMYYAEIGAANKYVGYAYAVQALSELPFFYFGQFIVNKIGAKKLMIVTMGVTMLRMLAYGLTSNPIIAIIIGSSHGICLALFMVAVVTHVHRFIPNEWRATGQSFIYSCYFGGGLAIGNIWIGFLSQTLSVRSAMIIESLLTGILILTTIMVFKAMRHKYEFS
jgi:MFS transporter, PPP family, 3-phenylpropionic acid transporter